MTRSTRSACLLVQITWCLSTSETTSTRVNTAPTALINSPPLHLVSPHVPIITMPIAPSGSARNAMQVATPATVDTLKTAHHALQLPPSATYCSRCAGQCVQEVITLTTLPVPACSVRSTSTAETAPIKTLVTTSSALLVLMATSYKVAPISVNLHATPISSPTLAITRAWLVILPVSLAVDLDRLRALPVSRLCFILVMSLVDFA